MEPGATEDSPCVCKAAGFCERFGRTQTPRDFNDCRRRDGVGAARRIRWARQARGEPGEVARPIAPPEAAQGQGEPARPLPRPASPDAKPLLLVNTLCPGDVLVMSAAIESLFMTYPDRFLVDVKTSCDAVYEHNPRVTRLDRSRPDLETIEMRYDLIHRSNQEPVHFLQGYVEHLAQALGVALRPMVKRPALYLSDAEKSWMNQVQEMVGRRVKFWLVNAGWKNCFTSKAWGPDNYQAVVNATRGKIQWVQVGSPEHNHCKLDGVIDLVGKTDARQLIRLAWNAEGGIGPSTFLQHIMAAHAKPYVCIHRAAEPLAWVSYPNQITLHRLGCLPCSTPGACWRSRTVGLGDGKDGSLCERPVFGGSIPIPKCLAMISPQEVVAAVESFYDGGLLTY